MPDELLYEMVRDHPFDADEMAFMLDLYLDWIHDAWVDLDEDGQEFHEAMKRKADIFLIDLRGAANG